MQATLAKTSHRESFCIEERFSISESDDITRKEAGTESNSHSYLLPLYPEGRLRIFAPAFEPRAYEEIRFHHTG